MDIYELAELMHDKLCHGNHIDGCSWYYENDKSYPVKDKWTEAYAHKEYLKRAEKTMESNLPAEDIAKVINTL